MCMYPYMIFCLLAELKYVKLIGRGDVRMPTSEARLRINKKYITEKLDEVKFRVPKGEKAVIQQHAARQGESVNGFIARAVKETMERDDKKE